MISSPVLAAALLSDRKTTSERVVLDVSILAPVIEYDGEFDEVLQVHSAMLADSNKTSNLRPLANAEGISVFKLANHGDISTNGIANRLVVPVGQ